MPSTETLYEFWRVVQSVALPLQNEIEFFCVNGAAPADSQYGFHNINEVLARAPKDSKTKGMKLFLCR